MRALNLLMVLALGSSAPQLPAADNCEAPPTAVTSFGTRYADAHPKVNGAHPTATLPHHDPAQPARYLRLRIGLKKAAAPPWQLTLRDNDLRPLQVFGPADFATVSSRWSDRLKTTTVKLDLASSGEAPELVVEEYIAMPESAADHFYSKQTSVPNWSNLFAGTRDSWRRAGDAVGLLVGGRKNQSWCCSGVLVQREPRLLFLTNFHCGAPDSKLPEDAFWSDQVCASTVVDFSWDGDDRSREFACQRVAGVDPAHDLALIELLPRTDDPGPQPPRFRFDPPAGNPELVLIHHQSCDQKHLSTQCHVEDKNIGGWRPTSGDSDFSHRCDTEAGSSGAPVFDSTGDLIGIHHLGFATLENGKCDMLNKGVWLNAARSLLAQAGVGLANDVAACCAEAHQ